MRNFLKSLAFILTVTGCFFIYMGLRVDHYNIILLIGGGIIALSGWMPLKFIDKKESESANKAYQEWKDVLLKNGLKIEVDLSKVKIKSNSYRQEIQKPYSEIEKYKALDSLAGRETREFKDINESILIHETEVEGNKHIFSSNVIYKDAITLEFLLSNQKRTFIYVDKNDNENYFFDLEFLYK